MFTLYADKNRLALRGRESLTSGSVNVYPVEFGFSTDWEGLERTAIFRAGVESRAALLDETGECTIPWEVLAKPGLELYCGVYGTQGGHTVLPTVWAALGTILPGAAPGESARPPTPDLWQQELDRKGDSLDYTPDGDLGLYAGDKLLSAVPISGGGGEGGVSDHRLLSHRDAEGQHPIGAVEGLQAALNAIPAPVEALTNEELEEMLK